VVTQKASSPTDSRGVPTCKENCLAYWDAYQNKVDAELSTSAILAGLAGIAGGIGESVIKNIGGSLSGINVGAGVAELQSVVDQRINQERAKCNALCPC
jgi:hypothetical protein